jgi:uncharacterized protein YjdB
MMTIVSFPSTTVQYVRIVQTGSKGNWWSIHEVYAFGSESPLSVSEISLEQEATLPIGNVYKVPVEFLPADPANKILFWKSDRPSIGTVDVNGKVTGIASGVANITAISMDGIKKDVLRVIVGDGTITSNGEPSNSNEYDLKLFPNPATGNVSLHYRLDRPQEVFAEVFNTFGMNVRTIALRSSAGENQVSLSFEGFLPGVYFFRLRTSEGTQTKKLVMH